MFTQSLISSFLFPVELKVELGDVRKQLEDLQTQQPGSVCVCADLEAPSTDPVPAGTLKVAFSAGLTDSGSVGPFDDETTLIFSKTFSNVGGAYEQSTGVLASLAS